MTLLSSSLASGTSIVLPEAFRCYTDRLSSYRDLLARASRNRFYLIEELSRPGERAVWKSLSLVDVFDRFLLEHLPDQANGDRWQKLKNKATRSFQTAWLSRAYKLENYFDIEFFVMSSLAPMFFF